MIIDKANKFNLLSTAETGAATAKPNKNEQNEVKHHLIDICDPKDSYSVNKFIEDTLRAISNIEKKK